MAKMAEFCTHIALTYSAPKDFREAYDNASLLISFVGSLGYVLHETLSGNENDAATVAWLVKDLCGELERRLHVLDDFHTASRQEG